MIMAMQSTTMGAFDARVDDEARKDTFFSRAANAYQDSFMKAGRARAMRELRHLSDAHLSALGLADADIAELRKTGRIPARFWG